MFCASSARTRATNSARANPQPTPLMPRLLGVDIPNDKRIEASLPFIYGIGPSTAKKILETANINPDLRAKDLSPEQLNAIIHAISASKLPIEGDLRRELQANLK